jgi:hypothetical protein
MTLDGKRRGRKMRIYSICRYCLVFDLMRRRTNVGVGRIGTTKTLFGNIY